MPHKTFKLALKTLQTYQEHLKSSSGPAHTVIRTLFYLPHLINTDADVKLMESLLTDRWR